MGLFFYLMGKLDLLMVQLVLSLHQIVSPFVHKI
jgi:hypothetical protein